MRQVSVSTRRKWCERWWRCRRLPTEKPLKRPSPTLCRRALYIRTWPIRFLCPSTAHLAHLTPPHLSATSWQACFHRFISRLPICSCHTHFPPRSDSLKPALLIIVNSFFGFAEPPQVSLLLLSKGKVPVTGASHRQSGFIFSSTTSELPLLGPIIYPDAIRRALSGGGGWEGGGGGGGGSLPPANVATVTAPKSLSSCRQDAVNTHTRTETHSEVTGKRNGRLLPVCWRRGSPVLCLYIADNQAAAVGAFPLLSGDCFPELVSG